MRPLTLYLIATTLIMSTTCFAHKLEVGQPLPQVKIEEPGELHSEGKDIRYQAWHTDLVPGKVRLIHAMAGRSEADEMNTSLIQAIDEIGFDQQHYQSTTIVDLDDAMFGTRGIIKSIVEENKVAYPWEAIILDSDGLVTETWELDQRSSMIIVTDKSGTVRFAHQGPLNDQQITTVLNLIRELI